MVGMAMGDPNIRCRAHAFEFGCDQRPIKRPAAKEAGPCQPGISGEHWLAVLVEDESGIPKGFEGKMHRDILWNRTAWPFDLDQTRSEEETAVIVRLSGVPLT